MLSWLGCNYLSHVHSERVWLRSRIEGFLIGLVGVRLLVPPAVGQLVWLGVGRLWGCNLGLLSIDLGLGVPPLEPLWLLG